MPFGFEDNLFATNVVVSPRLGSMSIWPHTHASASFQGGLIYFAPFDSSQGRLYGALIVEVHAFPFKKKYWVGTTQIIKACP